MTTVGGDTRKALIKAEVVLMTLASSGLLSCNVFQCLGRTAGGHL